MTMTNSSFPADAALGPGNPEPDIALGALRRAVLRARGFNLVFAVCNQPVQRDQLIEQLGHGLPEGVRVVHLSSNCTNVLAEVQSHLPPENTVPIVLVGLEEGLGNSSFDHPRIINLNGGREAWPRLIHGPVVIWVPEYLVALLARGAPAFLDWRSGTYWFLERGPVTTTTPAPEFPMDTESWWRLTAVDAGSGWPSCATH